jgi:hypothetical protein
LQAFYIKCPNPLEVWVLPGSDRKHEKGSSPWNSKTEGGYNCECI